MNGRDLWGFSWRGGPSSHALFRGVCPGFLRTSKSASCRIPVPTPRSFPRFFLLHLPPGRSPLPALPRTNPFNCHPRYLLPQEVSQLLIPSLVCALSHAHGCLPVQSPLLSSGPQNAEHAQLCRRLPTAAPEDRRFLPTWRWEMTSSPTAPARPSRGVVLPGACRLGGGAAPACGAAPEPRGRRAHVTTRGGRPGCGPRAGEGGVEAPAVSGGGVVRSTLGGRQGVALHGKNGGFLSRWWHLVLLRNGVGQHPARRETLGGRGTGLRSPVDFSVWEVPGPRPSHRRTSDQSICADVGHPVVRICRFSGPTQRKTVLKPERALL